MFENKKSILFITKSKIKVSSIVIDNKPKESVIGILDWTPQTLESILLKLKERIGNTARILLSEDFVYVVNLSFPIGIPVTRDMVRQKSQELIPESLNETIWDFRKTAVISSAKEQTIQVVAVIWSLFENLNAAIIRSGINIEAIEPLSYTLSRFTKRQDTPLLLVYQDQETLLTLAHKQVVITTQLLKIIPDLPKIAQFIAFAKDKFSAEIKNVIFCGETQNINLKQYANENFTVETQDINPMISLAYKEDLKGKDENVLNLALLNKHLPAKPVIATQQALAGNKLPSKTLIIVIGFIITLAIVGAVTYRILSKKPPPKISKSMSSPISTLTPSHIPLATQSAQIDKLAYTISILNGSNKTGEATKVKKLLEENGFNVVKIDNAEKNYEQTEVRFKEKVPQDLVSLLDKTLKTLYDFSIGTELEQDADSDILIIVGE